jgi:inhibitor of cysteine peptidase
MKRKLLLSVFAVASMLLLVTGCARLGPGASYGQDAGHATPGPIVLSEKDAGSAIEIVAGQQLSVRLPSNRTTGFGWVVADPGPLKQGGEPTYEAPQTPSSLVGAGGTETFTLKASTAGSGKLKLEYRRPWEKGAPAEQTWDVTVTVK